MRKLRGFSIVELLVALTIGSVLISGAVYVYSQSRKTSSVTESIGRMQENARYIFSLLEPELQMAGYYGFTNQPYTLKYISGGNMGTAKTALGMQKNKAALAGLSEVDKCGVNFAVDVIATVEGKENDYPFDLTTCPPLGGGYQLGTDSLTIRRSSMAPADGLGTATNGKLQLLANRLAPSNQFVFVDGKVPADPKLKKDFVQLRDLITRTYYISMSSSNPDNSVPNSLKSIPALRVKSLISGPAWADSEVMRGVEDLQVQFGVDTGDYDGDGKIDPGMDEDGDKVPDVGNGVATRYVNGDKIPAGMEVVSVRVWLLLRAEQPEQGFINKQTYSYAGKDYAVNDNFRRVLVSRTIQLRNGRAL
jgi:type IV pilus assembly protein PilW